jgi:hypothetical protein
MMTIKGDSERISLNSSMDKLFGTVLANNESFAFPFEKLKSISKLKSDDGFIRIFNWNLPLENGTNLYFAYIQHLDKKKNFDLVKLENKSESITNPESKELSDKNWYGALYYKILTKISGKITYYTLLGWDGNNNFTNKKIIDCFYFNDKKVIFGAPIFKMEKAVQYRIIFEFAEQSKMLLRYDEKIKMIVFDHLAPIQKKFEGQYMYYGPDMSQDGIQFKDGFWEYKANLDLRNMEPPKVKEFEKSF